MSGKSSRDKGHRWERKLANILSDLTGLDVRTTRSLGATYGADLATVTGYDQLGRPAAHIPSVLGWSIEAKAVKTRYPKAWVKQAIEQSLQGTRPVVLWKVGRKGSAFLPAPHEGWIEMPLDDWLGELV
jgi:hypothetical protein